MKLDDTQRAAIGEAVRAAEASTDGEIMVVTAANKTARADGTTLARERDALWRGLVTMYGGW